MIFLDEPALKHWRVTSSMNSQTKPKNNLPSAADATDATKSDNKMVRFSFL